MKTLLALAASIAVAVAQTGGAGLNWYLWTNTTWDYFGPPPTLDTSYFLNHPYTSSSLNYTGTQDVNSWETINYSPGSNDCIIPTNPPYQIDCSYIAVVFQGWFGASDAGNYTFTTDNGIDNALYFWSGIKAFHSWNSANVDYSAIRAGNPLTVTPGNYTVSLSKGAFLPVTFIWVNGGGIGRARMSITTPNGIVHTNTTGFFWSVNPFNPGPY